VEQREERASKRRKVEDKGREEGSKGREKIEIIRGKNEDSEREKEGVQDEGVCDRLWTGGG